MKTIFSLLRRALLALLVLTALLVVAWKSGLALKLATLGAEAASAGRVFASPVEAQRTDLALVPGTSIRGESLKQRVSTAAALYHAGKVQRLLLSGDGRTAAYHEPRAMRTMLRALGVPDEAMIEDPAGLTTYDSVEHALALMKGCTLTVVSQTAHCRRAILLARGLGADAQAVAADASQPVMLSQREQLATLRALLDLAGLRRLTTQWKQDRTVRVAGVKVAAL
jgi:SanA protein